MCDTPEGDGPPAADGPAGSLTPAIITTQAGKSAAAAALLAAKAFAQQEAASEAVEAIAGDMEVAEKEKPSSTGVVSPPPPDCQAAEPAGPAADPAAVKPPKHPAAGDLPVATTNPGGRKRKVLSGLVARLAKPKARRRTTNGGVLTAPSGSNAAKPVAVPKPASLPDSTGPASVETAAAGEPCIEKGDKPEGLISAPDSAAAGKEASPQSPAAASEATFVPSVQEQPSNSEPGGQAAAADDLPPPSEPSVATKSGADGDAGSQPDASAPVAPALPVSGPRRRVPSKLAIAAAESEAEVAACRGRGKTRGGSRGGKPARSTAGKRGGGGARGRGRGRPPGLAAAEATTASKAVATEKVHKTAPPAADADATEKQDAEEDSGQENNTGKMDDSKARKSYVSTKAREVWSAEEHERFIEAVEKYGRKWKSVAEYVHTRTPVQIRSHAQKYYNKLSKEGCEADIPPPRRKKRPAAPSGSGNTQRTPGAPALGSEVPEEGTSPGMAVSSDAETGGTRSGSGKPTTSLDTPAAVRASKPASCKQEEQGCQMKVEMEMGIPNQQGFGDGSGGDAGRMMGPTDPWQEGDPRTESWDPAGKVPGMMRQPQMRMQQQARQLGPAPGVGMGSQMGGMPQFDDNPPDNMMMQGGMPPDGGSYPMGDGMSNWGLGGMRQGMSGYGSTPVPGWGMESAGLSDMGHGMDHSGMDLPPDMRQAGGPYMSHSGYRMSRGMSGDIPMGWGPPGRGMPPGSGGGYYGDYPTSMMPQQQYWRGGMPGPSYGHAGMPDDFPPMGPGNAFDAGDGGPRMRMRGDVRAAQPMLDMDQQMYAQPGGFRQPPMTGNDSMMAGGFAQSQASGMDNSRYMMNESPVMEEDSVYSGSPGMMPSQQASGRNMYGMSSGRMGMPPYGMHQSDQLSSQQPQQQWRGMGGDSSEPGSMRGSGNPVYGNSPGAVMPDGGSMYIPGMPPPQQQRWSSGGGPTPHPGVQNRMYMPMG
mmetsp:Transcript_7221/g.20353  ORF Transcript_7221/g.20353 Transcript_7221/m.20353 type:complete len:983 (-) Transcript_7221:288-3236(-)|eukprot:CAMPEP_0117680436 /NCGR_PEP_ID=MMETSP0804-20121206/18352_1 /TAXON_ID=1074897 /ORGANISM="Tetraselmis astigmatica, Strain CCMP880" /LENGTH=982 /DNA_ID=CAMNT_0005489935 /DNA_START=129 /DNA_END=3077 /DNA_ORIENTATION=-